MMPNQPRQSNLELLRIVARQFSFSHSCNIDTVDTGSVE